MPAATPVDYAAVIDHLVAGARLLEEPASVMAALRSIRRGAGITARDLSATTGVSHISRLEIGHTHPSLVTLFALAHGLGHDLALVPQAARRAAHLAAKEAN